MKSILQNMPVEIKISFTDGTDTVVRIINDMNPQLFQWNFSKQPVSLVFDPNRNILLKQATTIVGLRDNPDFTGYNLYQNEPNPFTDLTTIRYDIPKRSNVKISIIDGQGKVIMIPVNEKHDPGKYRFDLTNEILVPGVYIYKLDSEDYSQSRKMIIVK